MFFVWYIALGIVVWIASCIYAELMAPTGMEDENKKEIERLKKTIRHQTKLETFLAICFNAILWPIIIVYYTLQDLNRSYKYKCSQMKKSS